MIENQACVDLLNWEIPIMVYIFTIFYVLKTAKTALGISYIIMIMVLPTYLVEIIFV